MIVKVCGVRTAEIAEVAVGAGADWIGVILQPGTPRFADDAAARSVVDSVGGRADVIGVLVEPTVATCREAVQRYGFDALQLHGDVDPAIVSALDVCVIRAAQPATAAAAFTLDWWPDGWLLLDAPGRGDGHGGTGQRVDTSVATEVARHRRIILSGGLTPENVAMAIAQVRPSGVDSSSGLEGSPGEKDPELVVRYVTAAREAQQRLTHAGAAASS